ncbi:MAG: hypothetical protein LAO51_17065 [Acidobacteriia bacterium]|nr:hypothetical protein [Terriglobia bacterium]
MKPKSSTFSGVVIAAIVLAVAVAAPSFAAPQTKETAKDASASKDSLERFLIISPHTAAQCLSVLDDMAAKEPQFLAMADWGCKAGDHTGYMFVEAPDEASARNIVPELVRSEAKVIRLNKFTPEQIKAFHQKASGPAAAPPVAVARTARKRAGR